MWCLFWDFDRFLNFCSLWETNKWNSVQKVIPLIITFIEWSTSERMKQQFWRQNGWFQCFVRTTWTKCKASERRALQKWVWWKCVVFFVKTKTPDFAWLSDILLNQQWSDKTIEIHRNRKKTACKANLAGWKSLTIFTVCILTFLF